MLQKCVVKEMELRFINCSGRQQGLENEPFPLINGTTPALSLTARSTARSHAAKWSRRKFLDAQQATRDSLVNKAETKWSQHGRIVALPTQQRKRWREPPDARKSSSRTNDVVRRPSPQPQTLLDSSLVDPFNTSAVPINGNMSLCLSYCEAP